MSYICDCCGSRFAHPKAYNDYRGECYGFPSWERVAGCPYCGGSYEYAESALLELGGNTGRDLEH